MPVIRQKQYNGGVNEEDFLADLAENQVRKAINAVISRRGSLRKREGSSQFGSDSNTDPVYALKGYTDNSGTVRRLKMISTTLLEYNAGAWNTTVKSGLTASKFLQMSDILVASTTATVTGTASSGTDYTLVDSGSGWTVNLYRDYIVKINAGTGIGQVKTILENTADTLTVDGRWDINPDSTSEYTIHAKEKGLICNNGTDTTFKVLGVTATSLATTYPKFTVQLVVNNRLFGIVGTKVYWSDLANGEAIGALNYVDTTETLTSIGKVGDFVAVYSKTKTGVIIGNAPDSFEFRWRDNAHGCIAPHSVANWGSYCFALAQDGVYVFDGTTNRLCSRLIKPSIDAMKDSDRVNATGFVFDNKYHLMHSENSVSTAKDRIWVMDLIWSNFDLSSPLNDVGVWTVLEGINANVMGTYVDSNGLQNLYVGKSTNSKVLQLYDGSYADEGSSIVFTVDTKEWDMDYVGSFKKLGWFFYEGEVQNVASDLQIYRNLDGGGFELFGTVNHLQTGGIWDVAVFDVSTFGAAERVIKRLRPGGRARTIQFEYYNNIADQPVEIFKMECMADLLRYH